MINRITPDTWEQWKQEIAYHISVSERSNAVFTAEEILKYLQDEGAFTLINENNI